MILILIISITFNNAIKKTKKIPTASTLTGTDRQRSQNKKNLKEVAYKSEKKSKDIKTKISQRID